MLLAIAPFVGLFILAAVGFTAVMVKEAIERSVAPPGHPRIPKEGDVVSAEFVGGSDWVVKVYRTHGQYEAQVIYLGEFQVRKTGFGTPESARGWGVTYAKQHGA